MGAHQGSIMLNNLPNKGCEATVLLPVKMGDPQ